MAGSALGYAVALAIHLAPQGSPVGAMLLNMAVFGAVMAYVLQMASFLVLRRRFPRMERPYVSPAGHSGCVGRRRDRAGHAWPRCFATRITTKA